MRKDGVGVHGNWCHLLVVIKLVCNYRRGRGLLLALFTMNALSDIIQVISTFAVTTGPYDPNTARVSNFIVLWQR